MVKKDPLGVGVLECLLCHKAWDQDEYKDARRHLCAGVIPA